MFKRQFWKEAFERAVKTAAQGAVAGVAVAGAGWVVDVSALTVIGVGALGGFALSIITSVASVPFGPDDSASLVKTTDR